MGLREGRREVCVAEVAFEKVAVGERRARGNRFGREGAAHRELETSGRVREDSAASRRARVERGIANAVEEGSTLARTKVRATGGGRGGNHRADTPRGPPFPWMASAEVGLAPSGCESYSPTYLAQALPDTLRLLRKRGAWEMSDHNEIAGQGERVRKILSLVKCLLTGERPRPSVFSLVTRSLAPRGLDMGRGRFSRAPRPSHGARAILSSRVSIEFPRGRSDPIPPPAVARLARA